MFSKLRIALETIDKNVHNRTYEVQQHDLEAFYNIRKTVPLVMSNLSNYVINDLFTCYSSLDKIIRTWCFVFQFMQNCQTTEELRKTGEFSYEDIKQSEYILTQVSQLGHFGSDIRNLKADNTLYSKLLSLTPLCDKDTNLMRVGGTIDKAALLFERHRPIISSSKGNFTQLVLQTEHERLLHACPRLLQNSIQERL